MSGGEIWLPPPPLKDVDQFPFNIGRHLAFGIVRWLPNGGSHPCQLPQAWGIAKHCRQVSQNPDFDQFWKGIAMPGGVGVSPRAGQRTGVRPALRESPHIARTSGSFLRAWQLPWNIGRHLGLGAFRRFWAAASGRGKVRGRGPPLGTFGHVSHFTFQPFHLNIF